jgi:molecular chaperone GrpE
MSKKKKKHAKAEEILVKEAIEAEGIHKEQDQAQTESDLPVEELDSLEAAEESPGTDLSPEEIMQLQTTLDESQAQAAEYLDGWQRARAEFSNYKKRVEQERQRIYKDAASDVIKRYLPVIDDLDRALKNQPQEGEGATWAGGIDLVYRKMLSILEAEGITRIEAEGQPFDPNMHEAIVQSESDEHESDQVIEVLEQGYMVGDRVLRPARVRVAA